MKTGVTQVACIGISASSFEYLESLATPRVQFCFFEDVTTFSYAEDNKKYRLVIAEGTDADPIGLQKKATLDKLFVNHFLFTVIVDRFDPAVVKTAVQNGIAEIFLKPLTGNVVEKLEMIISVRKHSDKGATARYQYKVPPAKRLFDIVVSSIALIMLFPVFLFVALLIRLESKGPVLYYSLRVGTGYKIFRFYKFRSMFVNADAKLSQLKHLNQYGKDKLEFATTERQICDDCLRTGKTCSMPLYADNQVWCEKTYARNQAANAGNAFVKIKDDPRITRIGKFIRNTSIDELPQLWNVLKGDMSIVGNRPLPLYEAEKLTTDEYALRFMAPAGITGLWQVSKRGKGEMSESERIGLDNDYAKSFGLWFDIKLILKTIPALFQKENV